jgi:hypothetical protein
MAVIVAKWSENMRIQPNSSESAASWGARISKQIKVSQFKLAYPSEWHSSTVAPGNRRPAGKPG